MDAQHWDAAEKWYKAAAGEKSEGCRRRCQSGLRRLAEGRRESRVERAIANLEKLSPDSPDLQNFKANSTELKSGQAK